MPNQHTLNAVLLAGIARSGTTWLSNILNYDRRYRSLFEPFHPEHGIPLREQVTNALYLRPTTVDETLRQGFVDLLSGHMLNAYVDQDNTGDYGERILLKSIRLNTMLPWLQANLPEVPIIYIARHPAAVIASQMRLGWDASQRNVKRLLSQPDLVEDYLAPYVDLMQNPTDEFEARLYFWCANNFIVREHFQNGEIYIVYYEQLKRQPIDEAQKLFAFLKQPLDIPALSAVVEKPSRTTWRADASETKFHWSNMLSADQQGQMWRTLETFGLSDIYNAGNAPRLPQRTFTQRVQAKLKRMTDVKRMTGGSDA